jgi:hypothetical protein
MGINRNTNTLSTVNAAGEQAANRFRASFSAPEAGVVLTADSVPSGHRKDFTDVDRKLLADEIRQNIADGYIGPMTVPGGAIVMARRSDNRLTFEPYNAIRRTAGGKFVNVESTYLRYPLGVPGRLLLTVDEMVAIEKKAVGTVILNAQKSRKEQRARNTFYEMQNTPLSPSGWAPGTDADNDALVEIELSAARLGYGKLRTGAVVALKTWDPGTNVDDDEAVREELAEYRARFKA